MRITLGNNATGQIVSLENADTILIEVEEAGEHMGQLNIRQVGGTLNIHGAPAVIIETDSTADPGINLDGGFWAGDSEQIARWHAEQRAQGPTHLTVEFP